MESSRSHPLLVILIFVSMIAVVVFYGSQHSAAIHDLPSATAAGGDPSR